MTIERELTQAARQVRAALARRDARIWQLRQTGVPLRAIGQLAGLTPQGVKLICDRIDRMLADGTK